MLKRDLRLGIIILILSIIACKNDKTKSEIYIENNFKKYSPIRDGISDSINLYLSSLLAEFTPEYMYGWVVDSLICINSSNNLLVAITIEKKGAGKGYLSDDAMKLLGKKINEKWFLFRGGGTLTIPRNDYGYSEYSPPSNFVLSQIARKEFLEGALIKNDKGEYIVNDKWVDEHFYQTAWGDFSSKAKYDSVHWFYITDKWKHKIDTNEYKPLRKNIKNNSVL